MKKLLALPIAFSLLCSACTASPASGGVTPETPQITSVVFQNQKTEAFVNLKQTQVKAPRVVDDVMLVPVRIFAEHFGAEVGWDEEAKRVSVTKDGAAIEFVVGENTVLVNGEAQTLGTAPVQDYDAVMVPVRPVAEAFGLEVSYDSVRDSVSAVKREGISPKEPETALLQEAKHGIHIKQ